MDTVKLHFTLDHNASLIKIVHAMIELAINHYRTQTSTKCETKTTNQRNWPKIKEFNTYKCIVGEWAKRNDFRYQKFSRSCPRPRKGD